MNISKTGSYNRAERSKGCPAETTLDFLSGKWWLMIIYWLLQGSQRFNQFQCNLGGITHRTLARTLREIEASGFLTAQRSW